MTKDKLVRYLITATAVVVIAVIAVSAVWIGLNKQYRAPSPLRCLPTWTASVVRIADRDALQNALRNTRYGQQLTDVIGGDSVLAFVARIDSLFSADVVSEPVLGERDLYISYALDGDTLSQLTASFCLNNRYEWHRAMSALKKYSDVSVRDTSINGHGLFVLSQTGVFDKLYMAAGGGCLFASLSHEVVGSFREKDVTSMRDDAEFMTIERTIASSSPISLYINRTKFSDGRAAGPLSSLFGESLLRSGDGSHWMAIDLGLHDDGMTSDGFFISARQSVDVMMASEGVAPLGLARRLPTGLRHFQRVAGGARGLSSKSFCEYLNTDTSRVDYRSVQSELYRQTNVDVEALLGQVFSAELALCSYSDKEGEGTFLVVDTRGGTMAQASLTQALTAMHGGASPLAIGEISPGSGAVPEWVTARRQDAQQVGAINVPVYAGFNRGDYLFFLPYILHTSGVLPLRLFFRYEDAIVFANDMSTLRKVLVDYVLGNTMVGRTDYDELMRHFSEECSRFYYDKTDPMTGFGTVCRQMTIAGRLPYVALFAQTADDESRATEQLAQWKIRLDSLPPASRLFSVTNHYTQLSECILQDTQGKINLIGADGMLLWKRAVDGPIVGNIHQIDYYDNHKLQYLFATERSLYIIDRLGNDVGPFPAHLHAKAVSGADVANYGDGSPLRFFVGCEGGALLYGPDGERVDGWNMTAPEGTLAGTGGHLVCGDKDYVVFHDQYSYYFNDRKGKPRLTTEPLAPSRRSQVTVDWQGMNFITTSVDGSLAVVDEKSGKVTRMVLDSISSECISKPIGEKLYFVATTRKATLVDITGAEPKVKTSWNLNLKSLEQVEVLGDFVALFDKKAEKVHVFTLEGKELMCSPLAAMGSVALGRGLAGTVLFTVGATGEVISLPVK